MIQTNPFKFECGRFSILSGHLKLVLLIYMQIDQQLFNSTQSVLAKKRIAEIHRNEMKTAYFSHCNSLPMLPSTEFFKYYIAVPLKESIISSVKSFH